MVSHVIIIDKGRNVFKRATYLKFTKGTVTVQSSAVALLCLFASSACTRGFSNPLTEFRFGFTTANSAVSAGACNEISLQLLDPTGTATAITKDVTVNLSGEKSGAYYSDSACTSQISAVTYAAGSTSVKVYYLNATSESVTLSAADGANQIKQTTYTVTVATSTASMPRLTFSGNSNSTATTCEPFILKLLNSAGVATSASATMSIDLVATGTGKFYSNSTCTTQITSTEIAKGALSTTLYFLPGTDNAVAMTASSSLASSGLWLIITAGADSSSSGSASLSFSPSSHDFGTIPVGSTADYTLTLLNSGVRAATSLVATIAAPFTFKGGTFPGTGGTCSTSEVWGGSYACTVVVTYTPTSTSRTIGNLTLTSILNTSTGSSSTLIVPLVGEATYPGTLDTIYTTAGYTRADYNLQGQQMRSIAVDGSDNVFAYSCNTSSSQLNIFKFNSSGALDSTFGTGGKVVVAAVACSITDDLRGKIKVQTDGKIIIAVNTTGGLTPPTGSLVRLTSVGVLDTTFNAAGATQGLLPLTLSVNDVIQEASGKYIVAATGVALGSPVGKLVRYDADGTNPSTLDTLNATGNDFFKSVASFGVGDFLIGGNADFNGYLYRYDDGGVNTWGAAATFNGLGGSGTEIVRAVAIDGSSRAIAVSDNVTGGTPHQIYLKRYSAAGVLDQSLTISVGVSSSYVATVYDVQVDSNGMYLITGVVQTVFGDSLFVVRVAASAAALDTTFNNSTGIGSGIIYYGLGDGTTMGAGIGFTSAGRIIIGGSASFAGYGLDVVLLRLIQ
jgi:hypothetical protein